MSARNRRDQKAIRGRKRADRKGRANVPHGGIITTKGIVLGQRYNAVKGLPFSYSIAAVAIASALQPPATPLMDVA